MIVTSRPCSRVLVAMFMPIIAAFAALAPALLPAPAIAQTCQPQWAQGFDQVFDVPPPVGNPGLNGGISAMTVFDDGTGPALYVGGGFTTAGGVTASRIAKWNGSSWSALGTGLWHGLINAMTVFDDGRAPLLYVGGAFANVNGVIANNIARWTGSSWHRLFAGTSARVNALMAFDDGAGPALFVGGEFRWVNGNAVYFIARWDGSAWGDLGGLVLNNVVRALAVFDDGSGPALYVGGDFRPHPGHLAANNIAKWNGSSWSALGVGIETDAHLTHTSVRALAVFDDGTGPALYAGGTFVVAGGVAVNNIARWDGSTWSPLGSGLGGANGRVVSALTVFDDGSGPALYAGGHFTQAGGVSRAFIAKWDGASWSGLGSGMNSYVNALAGFDDGTGSSLYAGGVFTEASGTPANYVAKWNGLSWTDTVGEGVNAGVNAMEVFDDGSGPAVFAGGAFTIAGNVNARHVGKFDGSTWSLLGAGVDGDVNALKVFDDGGGPALYAVRAILIAGVAHASRMVRWDGSTLVAVGGGISGVVHDMAIFDDGSGAALYAAGDFTIAGGVAANRIARWDGAAWSAVGAGMNDTIFALEVFDDGTGPALIAGGQFSVAGSVYADLIAKWNGTSWSAVRTTPGLTAATTHNANLNTATQPKAPSRAVFTLRVFDDGSGPALYAGGSFTGINGALANRVARWDGATWSAVGAGFDDAVLALEVFNNGSGSALYAGGDFTTAGATAASHMARWNGLAWAGVAAGTDGAVCALRSFFDPAMNRERLFVGGTFTTTGGLPSKNFGSFDGCPTPPAPFGLTALVDGAAGVSLTPTLSWEASQGTNEFELIVASSADLTTGVALDQVGLTAPTFAVPAGTLARGTRYYWGVIASNGTSATGSTPTVFTFSTAALGDFNFDGVVNVTDLATLIGNWGPCPAAPASCVADIGGAGDGVVNVVDLAALIGNWGMVN